MGTEADTAAAGRGGWVVDALWLLAWGVASSVWCLAAARAVGVTFDEPVYVARGLEHWRTGSHQGILKLGTMPLPIDVTTLPLYLWERWRGVPWDPVNDLDRLLPVARAGTLVFWWLLLVYGWRSGREIAGAWGGRLAVAFLACEPSLLAHASLATTDIAVSACLLALVYHFRVGRDAGWKRRVAVPAFWFAAAVLAKASGLVFGGLCLAVVGIMQNAECRRQKEKPFCILHSAFCIIPWRDLAWIVGGGLVLVFVYCGCDWRAEPSFVEWAQQLPDGPAKPYWCWFAEHLRIFSNAGEGIARQIKHNLKGHAVYLLGDWSPRAFWYYFPLALSIKLSLPVFLAAPLLALFRPRSLGNWACVIAAVLLAFSLTCRVQIGIRLVLPLVVFAIVGLAAAAAAAMQNAEWRMQNEKKTRLAFHSAFCILHSALLWAAWSAVAVWPNGLCYINELWGGTAQGYRYLDDSNYDWGQGLKELVRWQQKEKVGVLDVWYFGTDPMLGKLPLRELPLHRLPLKTPADVRACLAGRRVAVGLTLLYGSLLGDPTAHGCAAQFLRRCQPVARTATFFIYDFTNNAECKMQNAE